MMDLLLCFFFGLEIVASVLMQSKLIAHRDATSLAVLPKPSHQSRGTSFLFGMEFRLRLLDFIIGSIVMLLASPSILGLNTRNKYKSYDEMTVIELDHCCRIEHFSAITESGLP